MTLPILQRHLVYSAAGDRIHLCVCAARDKRHALKIARQNGLTLSKTAYAVLER